MEWIDAASLDGFVRNGGCVGSAALAADDDAPRDAFGRIAEINRASLVMTVETGIVPRARPHHRPGLERVSADAAKPGATRPDDYLRIEPLITAIAGPDATRMHAGRSRQDIIPTC